MYATPKVKFVFDRRKRASKTTNGAIEIEICFAGQRVRMSTGICVRLGEWADGKVVKRLDAQILNKELNDKYNDVYDTVKQMIEDENVCLDKLKDYRFGERRMAQKLNALDWIEERIELRPVRESTRKQHKVMLRALRASKLFYSFKDFTPANIKLWDDMLHKQLICQSSVHGYHKRLKPYIAEAIQLGLLEKSPYEGFHISRGRSNNRKYISAEERTAVEALELTGGEAKARDRNGFRKDKAGENSSKARKICLNTAQTAQTLSTPSTSAAKNSPFTPLHRSASVELCKIPDLLPDYFQVASFLFPIAKNIKFYCNFYLPFRYISVYLPINKLSIFMSEKYFVGNPLTGEMLVSIQGYPENSPYKYEFRSKPFRDEVALFNSQEEASEEFNKFSKPDDSILVTSIVPFNF